MGATWAKRKLFAQVAELNGAAADGTNDFHFFDC